MATRLISPAELSKRWSVPVGTLSNWRARRVGPPFIKLLPGGPTGSGGTVRYRLADIEKWEEAGYVATDAAA